MSEADTIADKPIDNTAVIGVVSDSVAPAESVPNAPNPAEQAPAAAPDGDKPAELTEEQRAKRAESRRVERKLSAAFRRAAEAEAHAKFLEQKLAESPARQAPQDPGAPKLEDFSDIEEFRKAVETHAFERGQKESDAKRQQAAQKQAVDRLASEWEKKVDAASGKYEDFDAVVGNLKPDSPWAFAVMEADNGADIAHYLGTHLAEAQQIARLSPSAQIRAIGRLEATLAATPPKAEKPSGAPAPIKPVGGSSAAATKKLSEMTQEEFEKKRRAQIAARR